MSFAPTSTLGMTGGQGMLLLSKFRTYDMEKLCAAQEASRNSPGSDASSACPSDNKSEDRSNVEE